MVKKNSSIDTMKFTEKILMDKLNYLFYCFDNNIDFEEIEYDLEKNMNRQEKMIEVYNATRIFLQRLIQNKFKTTYEKTPIYKPYGRYF